LSVVGALFSFLRAGPPPPPAKLRRIRTLSHSHMCPPPSLHARSGT
jgi:hypothetical protein